MKRSKRKKTVEIDQNNDDKHQKALLQRNNSSASKFIAFFKWIFLPSGPVSEDYIEYQLWDTLQGFIGYLKGIIITLAFLKGIGVGEDDGNLHSAMIIFICRDTIGIFAGLCAGLPTFTEHFSDKSQLKQWRLISELVRIIAGFLEIYASITPLGKGFYLPLSSIVAVLNTVAGVIGTQTRASLINHFARDNNFADCAAKEGNQDRGVKVFGIPLALVLLNIIGEKNYFSVYIGLVIVQFIFNVFAVRALHI